jgi:hypothetical protein
MASYPPPTESLPIFNVNEFIGTTSTSQSGGGGGGGGTFVNYPNAQGALALVGFTNSNTATLANTTINGILDVNNNITLSGDLVLDGASANFQFFDGKTQDTAYTGGGAFAGSYTNTNMTLDANGKITAIANGSAPSSILGTNNTWTGTNTFDGSFNFGNMGTANLTPTVFTNKSSLQFGNGGNGKVEVECLMNFGGFGALNLTNADITMNDDSFINQTGTHTTPNALYSINMNTGTRIQYPDATQQNSAFTGAGALAGTYTATNLSIDTNGRITAISNGSIGVGDADALYLTNTVSNISLATLAGINWQQGADGIAGGRDLQCNSTGQYVIFGLNASGLAQSSDFGETFTTTAGSFATEKVRGVAVNANGRYQIVATGNGANGDLFWSNTFGTGFVSLGLPLFSPTDTNNSNVAISAVGDWFYLLYLNSANQPTLYRYNYNSGTNVISLAGTTTVFGGNTSFSFMSGLRCSSSGQYLIFTGFQSSTPFIYYSNDFGATFTRVSYPSGCVAPLVGGNVFNVAVSQSGEIMMCMCKRSSNNHTSMFISVNYGANWAVIGDVLVNASAGFFLDRMTITGDGSIVYATGEDTAGDVFFYATNTMGQSWIQALGSNNGQRFVACSTDGRSLYSQRPNPVNTIVYTSVPTKISTSDIIESNYNFVGVPSYFEDFYYSGSSTTFGEQISFTQTGSGGTASIFTGLYDATIQTIAERRLGMLYMSSGGTSGFESLIESDDSYRYPMFASIAFGFIPLGASNFTSTTGRTDQLQVIYGMGVIDSPSGSFSQTGVYWRNTTTTSVVNWSLVEDGVIQETMFGTNLTGQLVGKWCRASITFLNNGANYFGEFWNLTNGAYYRTNTYATNAPNAQANLQIAINSGTTTGTTRTFGLDYVNLVLNTLPLGGNNATLFR